MRKILLIVFLSTLAFSQEQVNGYRRYNNVTAPGTPSSGTTNVYVDSTSKTLCAKDDTGTVTCTGTGGGGGSAGSQFAMQYSSNGAGGFAGTTPPTAPNGVVQVICNIPSGGAVAPTNCLPGVVARSVSGTTSTDSIASTDCNPTYVKYEGSVSVNITLPTATTLAVSQCTLIGANTTTGTNTTLTFTPTTWTINGSSTATVAQGQIYRIIIDPDSATNWLLFTGELGLTAGSGITFTRSATGLTLSSSGGGSGVTSIATTSPITGGTITTTGTIACATCVTSASSLTSNRPVFGSGGQATAVGTVSGNTTEVATVSGSLTSGNLQRTDTNGNTVDSGVCLEHYAPIAGSSDQISAAGAFATTQSVDTNCIGVGALINIRAHGVYTTTGTATPKLAFEVNAGGTTGICPAFTAVTITTSITNGPWTVNCIIQINTTGGPGTAVTWGNVAKADAADTSNAIFLPLSNNTTGTVSYTTTSAQTVSIQETGTLVSGQTFNLTGLDITVIK